MGAETSVVLAIFLLGFIVVSTGVYSAVDYSKNLVKDAQSDHDTMKNNKLQTDITITNVSFLNNSGNVYLNITIKNTGKTTLNASLLDIFVNGIYYDSSYCISTRNTWVPENSTNISIYSLPGQITIDNKTFSSAGAYSITWQHTVGQGLRNSLLVVGVNVRGSNNVMSITYAGVNLTRANRSAKYMNADPWYVSAEIWYLTNPKAGANDIVVTFPNATLAYAGAVSFSGVDQTNPIPTTAINNGDFYPNTSITTTNANAWIMDTMTMNGQQNNLNPTPPQTKLWSSYTLAITGGASIRSTTTAGLYYMSWAGGFSPWAQVVAEINPAICNKPTNGRIKVVTENGLWDYAIAS